jgi:Putative phage serine protease XkdF
MELYELIIEDENTDEVYALSLVENPAIEADWVYFTEHKEQVKFATVDNDKRTIVAPVLIPDKRIYRVDERTGHEYEVFVTAETIEKLAQQYLMKGYQNKATVEHGENIDGDVTVVESWVSKSSTKDKSANYFTRIFPAGTWFVTMKVNDEKLWQDYVKTGKVKAISIEGLFGHQLVKAAAIAELMEKDISDLSEDEAVVVLSKIRAVISKDKRYKEKKRIDFETYSDYGDGVKNNAKRGIELNEKNGNKCATQTGKVRAQQLAKGQPISIDTIKRMYSFLSRAETYYDAGDTSACGTISYLLWGGKAALGWSKNKLRELGLLQENEAQPSIPNSSYPGQAASGSVAPELLGDVPPILQDFADCPPATQNIALNLYNRSIAIKQANYGPLNPNEPNEDYWKAKADQFGGSVEEAKSALCGNCAFFDLRKETLNCIAEGIGYEDDPELVIEAGELGYCEAFDFKCAASRTCSAWVVGGPIKD